MRKVLMEETRPGRRALLAEPADAGAKKPVQGELDLEHRGDVLLIDTEAFLGYTEWFTERPNHSGWYDVKGPSPFPAPGHVERLWFQVDYDVNGCGSWKTNPDSNNYITHDDAVAQGWQWRGLQKPWPWGYRYYVPGGKSYRAQLQIGIVS